MRFGSLFSGIGGFDIALERAGMTCAWQVEKDASCLRVLGRHWPEVPKFTDVREVGRGTLGAVDLICGGFPCQDLSVAGRRAGLAGERSGLWHEFHRILSELRPRWVLIENVPGLLSSNRGRDLSVVLGGLAELGYWWAFRVLDAQYDHLAQRRERVFIVGSAGERGNPCEVLFEPSSLPGNPAPCREAQKGVAGGTEGGAGAVSGTLNSGGNSGGFRTEPGEHAVCVNARQDLITSDDLAQALDSDGCSQALAYGGNDTRGPIDVATAVNACKTAAGRQDFESETFVVAHDLRAEGADASEDGSGRGTPLVVSALTSPGGGPDDNKAQAGHIVAVPFQESHSGCREYDECGCLRANGPGHDPVGTRLRMATGVRRLLPVECERLQGFPDGHTAGESDSARYRMLGNAVAVPVVEWIARRIAEVASP